MHRTLALCVAGISLARAAAATDVAEVMPLTERWLMVHVDDGHVIHHTKGQRRNQERVVATPLDTARADRAGTWTITSASDAQYRNGRHPKRVGRKSKGTDFAWLVEGWKNNRAVNVSLDHAKEHWIYLELPSPLRRGAKYTVSCGGLIQGCSELVMTFDERSARSEAVHVNIIGYAPEAPAKYGYVHHWMGNLGGLEVRPLVGRTFRLVDTATGTAAFTGKLAFRFAKERPETLHKSDSPPHGNFLKADVCEADFSTFAKPGKYVLSVDGVGRSFPFEIDADVYREPFVTAVRGLYHNRSGIALEKPYTEFERPAPHNPKLTPNFAGKLVYTRVREWEAGNKENIDAHVAGPVESCGWYQDAGDWDGYYSHLNVGTVLLFAFETAPDNFRDGEQNIPESGNGIPDLLDEAAWLPRYLHRLRHELMEKGWGTGGVSTRVCGDYHGGDGEGVPSYLDVNRRWVVFGEDVRSTYRYAGVAAHLAWCMHRAGLADPEGVDWVMEALESYAWARANQKPADEKHGLAVPRAYAAAGLFRLTGEKEYEDHFRADTAHIKRGANNLWHEARYGPWVYVLGGGDAQRSPDLHERIRSAVLASCNELAIVTPSKRALRWGGIWSFPMLVGHQTTPWIMDGIVGHALTKESDPRKAEAFKASVHTTCDYFLGTNALNATWVTGLGERHPTGLFHMDAWYNGKGKNHPGLIPYGPWRKDKDLGQGPWDQAWPHQTVFPGIDHWPGNERWFDNRCSPMNSEFTVHQNSCYAAALFGWLCGPAR